MELFRTGRLGRLTLLLLALFGSLAGSPEARRRGRGRHRHQHGDIREHIDTDEVLRTLESQKRPAGAPPSAPPGANGGGLTSAERLAAVAQLRPDVLKSSRRARLITKRRYLKQDWCKTEPLVRRLREPGCRSRRVLDHFCYGQCNSFYIPREGRRRRGGSGGGGGGGGRAFQSCAFCQPRRWHTVSVTFHCPGRIPAQQRRHVKLVKRCSCSAQRLTD